MLSFNGDGHQERPADPADRLEQLTDERLDKMFSEMKARGDGDALELDLHEFEWDSAAAGIQTAIVRPHVWCMPIDKVHKTMNWACKGDDRRAMRANQFLLAQQRVVEECGLLDATTKVWIDPVDAIVPEYGVHIWWNGLWMEKADGISLSQLSRSTNRAFYGEHIWWNGLWMKRADGISMHQLSYVIRCLLVTNTITDLIQVKLNKTRVVEVALMDLLTTQCDRHSQNVFIDEHGNIKVIDNLQAMHFSGTWRLSTGGANSLFLPGTGNNEVVRFGLSQVTKQANANINAFKKRLNPMVLLDYRFYVDGGEIGNNYPPRLNKCLTKLANMSAEEVTQEYKFPILRNGQALGFEWTLKFGTPSNPDPKRYLWHQPCCSIVHEHGTTRCGHKWNASAVFPIGDPYNGGKWYRKYPDPGQFVGGTRCEW
eukprot:gene26265-17367_t